jgi:tetrahydromethanopterin S-methyltransferase subunit G
VRRTTPETANRAKVLPEAPERPCRRIGTNPEHVGRPTMRDLLRLYGLVIGILLIGKA